MSYPPPPPPPPEPQSGPPQSGPPFDPTRPMDPSAPPPSSPAGPPPAAPLGTPAGPVFQPGKASPSYGPPPPQTGYQPVYDPTSAYAYQPQQGYPAPGYPPAGKAPGARSSSTVVWVLVAVFAILLCGGAATAGVLVVRNAGDKAKNSSANPPAPAQPAPAPATENPPTTEPSAPDATTPAGGAGMITFEVTGDGPATISFLRGSGQGTERVRDATLPWQAQVPKPDKAFVVSLLATRAGGDSGTITCRVLVDGKELVKRSATGGFATVSCIDLLLD
jgi:MmpS family membrane protein